MLCIACVAIFQKTKDFPHYCIVLFFKQMPLKNINIEQNGSFRLSNAE